jgi:hypothetical protein
MIGRYRPPCQLHRPPLSPPLADRPFGIVCGCARAKKEANLVDSLSECNQAGVERNLFLVEHVGAQVGLSVGYTQLTRPLVGGRQQSPDPTCDGVLGQRWFVHLT